MQITIDITDQAKIDLIEKLRGEQRFDEFVAAIFDQGLKFVEARRRQQEAANEAGKHPLLQFPEAKPEFRATEPAAIEAALKAKSPQDPVVVEINRLVSTYVAQMNLYAAQNGGRMPPAVQVKVEAPVQRVAFQIALAALKRASQTGASVKTAA